MYWILSLMIYICIEKEEKNIRKEEKAVKRKNNIFLQWTGENYWM